MKIAIYNNAGSFSDRWIEYCQVNKIPYIEIDIYSSNLIEDLTRNSISYLLAHPTMAQVKSEIAAKSILRACEISGLHVFPTDADYWHFDDKISQKYIFESLGIPSPKAYVFFDKVQALQFAETAEFPLVFKLRRGAGSINVELVRSKSDLIYLVNKMFGKGISANDAAIKDISTKMRIHKRKNDWISVIKRAPKTIKSLLESRREIAPERGYVYLQEFMPNNRFDIRVNVIGERAFMFKRMVRPGDFRASGSYLIDRTLTDHDRVFIELAFKTAKKLKTTCIALDLIMDKSGNPVVVEMSYAFNPVVVFECDGYWTPDMRWVEGNYWPQDLIFQDLMDSHIHNGIQSLKSNLNSVGVNL